MFEVKVDGWERVKQAALFTIGKKAIEGKEITTEWKHNILLSRHSPIRELRITIAFKGIERWIADQLVRHSIGVNNYMKTNRPDRGGIPRDEQLMTMPTDLLQVYNAESFINLMETRLCIGCVSRETRLLLEDVLDEVAKTEPELAHNCVPSCIMRCGCKEAGFINCNHYKSFFKYVKTQELDGFLSTSSIPFRYELYKQFREKTRW